MADGEALVLLKRFLRNRDVEKARVEFERAQKVKRFHKEFDGLDFTSAGPGAHTSCAARDTDDRRKIPTSHHPLATILRLILPLRRTLIFRQALHRATEALAPVMHATRPCRFQLDPLCGCQHLV